MSTGDNIHDMQVYSCTFEVNLAEAEMAIKFPCSYYVEIRSMNNKISIATTRNKVTAVNSIAVFNQLIKFETELLFNKQSKVFIKKEVLLLLNLVSARRPDEQKLVGRLVLDLSQAIQTANFADPKAYRLEYCSVKALLTFSCKYLGKRISKTLPSNFDKDSFSDFQSFVAGIHNKDNPSKQRSYQETEKTVQIGKRVKNNDSFQHHRIIEESNNEDNESKVNTGRNSHKIVPHADTQNKEQNRWKQDPIQTVDARNANMGDNYTRDFQILNRIKSDLSQKSYSKKQSVGGLHSHNFNPTSSQYQEILKNSYTQQKRIWEQEKRMLNQQIAREKHEQSKLKQKIDWLEKKLYESELKLCTLQTKIEHSAREMTILQREKELELKELRSKLQRVIKQRDDRTLQLQRKQLELKEAREKIRSKEYNRDRNHGQLEKQRVKLQQNLQSALKRVISSEELVGKLQKEKKDSYGEIEESEKKLLMLQSQNNILKSKLEKLQSDSTQWTTEKSKLESEFSLKIKSLTNQYEKQQKQMKNKLQDQKNKAYLEMENYKMQQLSVLNQNKKEVEALKANIEELIQKLTFAQQKTEQFRTEIQKKSDQLISCQNSYKKKLEQLYIESSRKLKQQALKYEKQLQKFQQAQLSMEEQTQTIKDEIQSKEQQIRLLNNSLKEKSDDLLQSEKEYKEYVAQLQKQVLLYSEQLNTKDSAHETLKNEVLLLKQAISQMKVYQKGLQEDILKLESTLEEAQLGSQQVDTIQLAFNELQIKTNNQIERLSQANAYINNVLAQRNNEIQSLIANKGETKEYIFTLESQILKLTTENENVEAERKRSLELEKFITNLKQQIKQKNQEIEKISVALFQMKKQKIELDDMILKLKSDNDNALLQAKRQKTEQKLTNLSTIGKTKNEIVIQQKLRDAQRRIQQKVDYIKQLEEKVLHDNSGQETERLNKKIRELTQKISQMSEYQQGLEQKILNDFQKMQENVIVPEEENTKIRQQDEIINYLRQTQHQKDNIIKQYEQRLARQNEKFEKLSKEHQVTILHLKQYQEGLEEKILHDYEKNANSNGLQGRLQQQQVLIDHLKEYQTGLEENILQAYQTNTSSTLQRKVKQLEDVIKHLKDYQEGLQEKILEDHQNVEGDVGLKSSIKLLETQLSHQKEYQAGLEEKILADHQILQKFNDKEEKVLTPNDEDFLVLQEQINQKNLYIEELEFTIKNLENEIGFLHNQMNQSEAAKDLQNQEDQDYQKQLALNPTVIRVIEADSQCQQQQVVKPDLQKIESSKQKNPASSFLKDILANNEGSQDKQKDSAVLQKHTDTKIKQLEEQVRKLENQKLLLHKDIQNWKQQFQNTRRQQESAKAKQQQQMKQIQLIPQQEKVDAYIQQLEKTIKEHELRIRQFKGKEDKMQQTLFIIEEQSYKIVDQLSSKYEQCEHMAEQLRKKQEIITSLQGRNHETGSKEAEFNSLLKKYSQKDQEISTLKQKLSWQSQQSSKYEDLIQQLELLQSTRKQNLGSLHQKQMRIKSLESQLKEVNDQLMTSKRLVGKLRENRQTKSVNLQSMQDYAAIKEENVKLAKRIEQLEQQVFSYQSNENQKDIVIQSLRADLASVKDITKIAVQPKPDVHSEGSTVIKLQVQIDDLKSKVKTNIIELDNKSQKILYYESQIKKLEALIKAQRLDYYDKTRQSEQEIQKANKNIEEQLRQLAQKENKIRELENKIQENEKKIIQMNQNYQINLYELEATKKAYSDQHLKHSEQLKQSKMALLKNSTYIQSLEAQIQQNFNMINQKNEQLRKQVREGESEQNKQVKELQNQLNFYSQELAMVTKKLEELEPEYYNQKTKLEDYERVIEQLNEQLKICQQQNEYHLATSSSPKQNNKQPQQCLALSNRIAELEEQLKLHRQISNTSDQKQSVKIEELELRLRQAISEKEKAVIELEEKQMEHMNTELDLQFKLREKNQKSQVGLASSFTENQQKKSLSASQQVGAHDIIPASKVLKQLISSRSNRSLSEKQIQVMVGRITQLEDQLYGASSITKQKGLILEKTRLVSMQFTKLKVNIMKSKLPNEERMKLLAYLKPIEACIKDILQLSEIYSENLLTLQLGQSSRT